MKIKKNRMIVWAVLVLALLAVAAFFGYRQWYRRLNVEEIEVFFEAYKDVDLTQEHVDEINSMFDQIANGKIKNDWWTGRMHIADLNDNQQYGELFDIFVRYEWTRKWTGNDYKVSFSIDYSNLDEDEQVFFAEMGMNEVDELFHEEDTDKKCARGVGLCGCTYGMSYDAIAKIANKLKVYAYIEDQNGHVSKRQLTVCADDYKVGYEAYEGETYESFLSLFKPDPFE